MEHFARDILHELRPIKLVTYTIYLILGLLIKAALHALATRTDEQRIIRSHQIFKARKEGHQAPLRECYDGDCALLNGAITD